MRSTPLILSMWLCGALVLGGCSSTKPRGATRDTPSSASASPRPEVSTALITERQWLQSWFKGTPVRIAQQPDGAVSVDVPREFCFDVGKTSVKPALAAVLDKVAESLRRKPQATIPLLAAPDDAGAPSPLALQRAQRVERYLQSRGVAASRLGKPVASRVAAVQLRIEPDAPD